MLRKGKAADEPPRTRVGGRLAPAARSSSGTGGCVTDDELEFGMESVHEPAHRPQASRKGVAQLATHALWREAAAQALQSLYKGGIRDIACTGRNCRIANKFRGTAQALWQFVASQMIADAGIAGGPTRDQVLVLGTMRRRSAQDFTSRVLRTASRDPSRSGVFLFYCPSGNIDAVPDDPISQAVKQGRTRHRAVGSVPGR